MRNFDNRTVKRTSPEIALDVVNLLFGTGLVLAPWALGFAGYAVPTWNAIAVGAAIMLVAIGALAFFAEWQGWTNLLLGAWTVLAPWLLGFASAANVTYVHVVMGLLVAMLAALELWMCYRRPTVTA